ncbi:hypothetical protein ASPZODRAFT_162899 [Penicilliopsis zonata CBS 506.65]|uniref:Serine/threonine-protein kinase Tel1 n=1 Tax=Penicilliopsis zonata CBS 506.65 TaxID=1073090 RepID=A0A1L9SUV8_9EURO|nr:hypothetical protein ASPZODRAFT_162899 [Penicilliopsis zonata CBS 506.65]OJJ51010.1 hypothetical protein ASPZODRAFT_162899 [Penicilliopsis zonata CBS 506.65]
MGEITLDGAIALLSSDKLKDRSDGLADLKHILQQNKQSTRLNTLNDKACHKILESLFRFIAAEKSAYTRALKSHSKTPSTSRLTACAAVLRTAVDVFVRNLRSKSVRAIVDHITDTLRGPGEGLWGPLSVDYTKCLRVLLQYPPHVEHLADTEWEKLMKFCLRALDYNGVDDGHESPRHGSRAISRSLDHSSALPGTPRAGSVLAVRTRHEDSNNVNEEVLLCIQSLTASSTAPIRATSDLVLRGLRELVMSAPVAANTHQIAFNSINTVVMRVIFDQSEVIRSAMLDIIPVIRRLWATKHSALKDDLLVTVMLCMNILADAAARDPSESLFHTIESLVDTLQIEYSKRSEKDILQLDELTFSAQTGNSTGKLSCGPRLGNNKSEHNWTVLWTIATLLQLAEDVATRLTIPEPGGEAPNKKRRFTSRIEDILRESFSSSGVARLCALQLLLFLGKRENGGELGASLVERLIPNILDDNGLLSSWTLLALSSIATRPDSKAASLRESWQKAWELASRASTSQVSCRAACHLMCVILEHDLLEHSVIAETTRSMLLSANLNGPSIISDSSLNLWAKIAHLNTQIIPGPTLNVSKHICGWLREFWSVGILTDRAQAAQVATFTRPLDFLRLLLACTNRFFPSTYSRGRGLTGIIGKAWYFHYENRKLLEYLFQSGWILNPIQFWDENDLALPSSSYRQDPNDLVFLDLLQAKCEAFSQTWHSMNQEKSHHITVDIMQIAASLCISTILFTESLPQQQYASRLPALRQTSQNLWATICSFLESREIHFSYACLELLSPMLSPSHCFKTPDSGTSRTLRALIPPLTKTLESHRLSQKKYSSQNDIEVMDLDDPLITHGTQLTAHETIFCSNRDATPLFSNIITFNRCLTVQLSALEKYLVDVNNPSRSHSTTFVKYLIELDDADILSAQSILPHVYQVCAGMERATLLDLLENFAEKSLQSYELERCENSTYLAIKMMASFVKSWTCGKEDHLNESASDIYEWFINVLITKGKASTSVYVALAELLGEVIRCNPMYSTDGESPSPRTSLFTVFQDGDVRVKFSAADMIRDLFERFALDDHEVIFNDVLESLPRDPDWVEGIALRLFILAQLASRWHTLLRRSIYHIFETPAQVPQSVRYAQKCLLYVAKTLGLEDPKELFRLFSSQILYTWTETQDVKSIPFGIFGYPSLKDLVIDVQDEIVGQLMMRVKENEATETADILGIPFPDLLSNSFHKAEAYSIARDITTPPSQNSQPKGVENRLKKLLGAERFSTLVEERFPQTIAAFFKSLDQFDQIERAFTKRPGFKNATEIQRRIFSISASAASLPAGQQPSFRARFLLDELDFLCRRTGYELEAIWTPTLTSYVCRTLLESIHPALGSLHACSVIRKIRILICLAGSVVLQDYPLELMLHGLRSYLTDPHCSEDAIGIYWYLLEAGNSYLTEHPGLMAETAVSTFVTLRKLLRSSSPKETAHDDQYQTVLSNAKRFQKWFGDHLGEYRSAAMDDRTDQSFRRLIKLAESASIANDTTEGSDEILLIYELLGDRHPGQRLLRKPISDLALSILCADFRRPPDNLNTITGKDMDATTNAVAVLETVKSLEAGSEYRLWAARTIGRAFADTSGISDVLSREQDPFLFKPCKDRSPEAVLCHSKFNILQVLCNMLQTGNHTEVGLVERTLQLIVSNLASFPDFDYCGQAITPTLMKALIWSPYQCPAMNSPLGKTKEAKRVLNWDATQSLAGWARSVGLFLSEAALGDPVTGPLKKILDVIPSMTADLLPYILHDVLLFEFGKSQSIRQTVSEVFMQALRDVAEPTIPHARLIINCILYLRNQQRPEESTIVERDEWLDIDFGEASLAANKCRMHKTSLLLLEIHASRAVAGSRRSSVAKYDPSPEFLHSVFRDIDDPDLFYGIQQKASLESVMDKLSYESSALKNLLFQSAQYDSDVQMLGSADSQGVLKALNSTNLQGIASALYSGPGDTRDALTVSDSMIETATSLRRWDIAVPPSNYSSPAIVYRAFQNLNTSKTMFEASRAIDECLLETLDLLGSTTQSAGSLKEALKVLGLLADVNDVVCSTSPQCMDHEWQRIMSRKHLLRNASFRDVGKLLNWHEALVSSITSQDYIKTAIQLTDHDTQLLQVKTVRQSLDILKDHDLPQASLKGAIYINKLVEPCAALGINIDAAAKFDLANVLWEQGEMTTSIRMLQQLNEQNDLNKQTIPVSCAELLVTLGHHVAEARLEKPDAILQEYLVPAVKELKGCSTGDEAGRVFHGFAMFCDQQLQNPDGLEDFKRVEQLRDRKEKELLTLEEMMKTAEGKEKDGLKMYRSKTKQWFDLDDREYQRLRRSREAFLHQCLENYLLSLKASDAYNNDALRFCALWLDNSDSSTANSAVSKYINHVPSRKFATLMNQLSSRLLDVSNDFQPLISTLIFRICVEHPFHGMYQIFASSKSKGGKDEASLARYRAANKLVDKLKNDKRIGPTWIAVHNTNISYVRFAVDRHDEKLKSGARVPLKKLITGARLEIDATANSLPPPTMKIEIRPDCDYSAVPTIVRFGSDFTVASGVSAPKIVTAIASDGLRYKQLFKGGNDDLRQDAIMEQVFEQVSSLLKDHQATRQRNLGIRTYKVLPLTSNAGIIEFVPNTIPLHDYLMPAHQRYYPKDMKPSVCRKHIGDVQTRSLEHRVRTYRQVTERFHPVMRFFFMENFNNPDDWFSKRLAYIRSTAAISILGHVLGLGDRHGHNILLDEKTGEAVHIDLGVAFEQGRVLPVPEVVPFRLTRDLVDGMGITKTEGVFRRCCEFTLEALRQESYGIMTILDVLRYDPLYSWTVSPLRMKRMQETSEAGGEAAPVLATGTVHKKAPNEPSEADRALTVVAKKLSKTLSVTATVNELIQQATDERNLAVLYCGWAAYA